MGNLKLLDVEVQKKVGFLAGGDCRERVPSTPKRTARLSKLLEPRGCAPT